ncbi:hypothetical protein FB451DRAFT_1183474 [Mycena latifolia]|nr:hypothetical protein FB451DRAFT_1183474 [Mycena latifolia]
MFRAQLQALGPPGRARPGPSRAEPDAGPERAQGLGLMDVKPEAGPSSPGLSTTCKVGFHPYFGSRNAHIEILNARVPKWKLGVREVQKHQTEPDSSPDLGLEALPAGSGLGLENLRPKPGQSRPKPGLSGRAGP